MWMNHRRTSSVWFAIFVLTAIAAQAAAEDAFYRVPLADLMLTEGKLSDAEDDVESLNWRHRDFFQARVILDGEGEAYVEPSQRNHPAEAPRLLRLEGALVARAPASRDLTGSLYDPVRVHAAFWQTRLVGPGGGQYVWNDRWQTME